MALVDFGKLRGNYLADPENLLKLADDWCCGTNYPAPCQETFSGTVNSARKLDHVTITHPDGTAMTVYTTLPITQSNGKQIAPAYGQIAVTDTAKLEEWLTKVAELFEFDIYLRVTYVGGTLTIVHRGRTLFSGITFDNASTMSAADVCCDIVPLRVWKYVGVDAIGNFVFGGGTPVVLANNPYEYTGTSVDETTAATLQTDVIDALDSLADDDFTYFKAEVKVNNAQNGYTIKVWTTVDEPILVGDSSFAFCEMDEAFICE